MAAFDTAGNVSIPSPIVTIPLIADVSAPTPPSGVVAQATSPTTISLSVHAATDNVGVTGYTLYRNATQIGTTGTSTSYVDSSSFSPLGTYVYTMTASDASGNV